MKGNEEEEVDDGVEGMVVATEVGKRAGNGAEIEGVGVEAVEVGERKALG